MRLAYGLTLVLAAALIVPSTVGVGAQDANRKVAGGGISIPGWQGKADDSKENAGSTIQDGKLAFEFPEPPPGKTPEPKVPAFVE